MVDSSFQLPDALARREKFGIGMGAFCGAIIGAKLPFVFSDLDGLLSGAAWFTDGKTIVCGLVGGYVVGIVAGSSIATLNIALGFTDPFYVKMGMIVFGALATGLAMFLMVVTKIEHPPAAALALGLVLNEWTAITLVVVIVGVVGLSVCKQLVLPHLMDLS